MISSSQYLWHYADITTNIMIAIEYFNELVKDNNSGIYTEMTRL